MAGRDVGGGNPKSSPRAAGAPGLHARGSIPRVSEADEAGAGWGARYDDLLQRTAAGTPACRETALQTCTFLCKRACRRVQQHVTLWEGCEGTTCVTCAAGLPDPVVVISRTTYRQ